MGSRKRIFGSEAGVAREMGGALRAHLVDGLENNFLNTNARASVGSLRCREIEREREREREVQREGQTERQRQRWTHGHTQR